MDPGERENLAVMDDIVGAGRNYRLDDRTPEDVVAIRHALTGEILRVRAGTGPAAAHGTAGIPRSCRSSLPVASSYARHEIVLEGSAQIVARTETPVLSGRRVVDVGWP